MEIKLNTYFNLIKIVCIFLMDMIASGSAAAAPHADDTANTDIYLNMSGGEEIDQNTAAAADQEANVYT